MARNNLVRVTARHRGARRTRRGVILLVVLGLLALFTLIALTLVLATSQARTSALAAARADRTETPPSRSIKHALRNIVVGTNNPNSVARSHDLLNDMYGDDDLFGRVGTGSPAGLLPVQVIAGGEMLYLTFNNLGPDYAPGAIGVDDDGNGTTDDITELFTTETDDTSKPIALLNHYYSGRLVTMIDGPAKGRTTRVTGYEYDPTYGDGRLRTASFGGPLPQAGNRFLINGRPFNGKGFAVNTVGGVNVPLPTITRAYLLGIDNAPGVAGADDDNNGNVDDETEVGWPGSDDNFGPDGAPGVVGVDDDGDGITDFSGSVPDPEETFWPGSDDAQYLALAPNAAALGYREFLNSGRTSQADEDYDAPDYLNMMLAGQIWKPALGRWHVSMPSLHRPDLVNYWITQDPGSMGLPFVRSRVMLRPEPTHHVFSDVNGIAGYDLQEYLDLNGNGVYDMATEVGYDFNGNGSIDNGDLDFTGKTFHPIDGPWDVDNDGEGTPDSIWTDQGLPVVTGPDGRQYKPLVATLVLDLDSRLNLNAHGKASDYRYNAAAPFGEEYVTSRASPFAGAYAQAFVDANSNGRYDPGETQSPVQLTIGSGYGPADVNLAPMLPDPYPITSPVALTVNEYRRLLEGRPPIAGVYTSLPGRYGDDELMCGPALLLPSGANQVPGPGWPTTGQAIHPGFDGVYGTTDDFYSGDDNSPAVCMGAIVARYGSGAGMVSVYSGAGGVARTSYGNMGWEGFFPGLAFTVGAPGMYGLNGSPPGLSGSGSIGLDPRGQPFYWNSGYPGTPVFPAVGALQEAVAYDPYELDLSRHERRRPDYGRDGIQGTADDPATAGGSVLVDNPFKPSELEPLLRIHDADISTQDTRIGLLAPSILNSAFRRRLVTTDSQDVPAPSVSATPELASVLTANGISPNNLHITDLLYAKLLQAGYTGGLYGMNGEPFTDSNLNGVFDAGEPYTDSNGNGAYDRGELRKMMATDLLNGLRMDINRPFGNGLDDNGNGVVDEPAEIYGERLWRGPGPDNIFNTADDQGPDGIFGNYDDTEGVTFDADNDGYPNTDADRLARQDYARNLYLLLMLFKDSVYNHPLPAESPVTTLPIQQEATARKLAQWAINVVDFRDRDCIMTAFEYDIDPFGANGGTVGWNVDGWIGTTPGPDRFFGTPDDVASPDDAHPDRRIVWGCEYPDLLLTETMALHDRRVKDLNTDSSGKTTTDPITPDPHFDQERIPQGATFLEVYCTRNPNNPAFMGDLYTPDGYLDLGRRDASNAGVINAGNYAVWRLAVTPSRIAAASPPIPGNTGVTTNNVVELLQNQPESTSLDLMDMNLAVTGNQRIDPERIVWLGGGAPTAALPASERNKIYYNQYSTAGAADTRLAPGQYAVVGPYRNPATGPDNVTTVGYTAAAPYAQEIRLGDQAATLGVGGRRPVVVSSNVGNANSYPKDPNTTGTPGTYAIQEPVGIAVAGNPTQAGSGNPGWTLGPIGFSISEPLFSSANYYTVPNNATPTTVNHYTGPASTIVDMYMPPLDEPLDNRNIAGTLYAETPGGSQNLLHTGTTRNFKAVFLQRLADPTLPYNPMPGTTVAPDKVYDPAYPVNPYITMDWMPIDLTVFNGEASPPAAPTMGFDPDDPSPDTGGMGEVRFSTRQRGKMRSPPVGGFAALWQQPDWLNIWRQPDWGDGNTPNLNTDPPRVSSTQPTNFGFDLDHTLGYLNKPFHDLNAGAPAPWWELDPGNPAQSLPPGYANDYVGDPKRPFPWLTWHNRPFANSMELLLVPSSSPSRLLYEFDVRRTGFTDHYAEVTPGTTTPYTSTTLANQPFTGGRPFNHLLEFFAGNQPAQYPSTALPSSNYFRIFEYLHVPSRFSGTEDLLNPATFSFLNAGAGIAHDFHPPFNRLSRLREPGRININTIFDDGTTMQCVLNRMQEAQFYGGGGALLPNDPLWGGGLLWAKIVESRRGYAGAAIDTLNGAVPTILANPFRSFTQSYTVPVAALTTNVGTGTIRNSVDGTLFRPDPALAGRPLFAPDNGPLSNPTYSPYTDNTNTDRNAYFRYQALEKLGSVFTTRSNVYAIWVTVGYFEVQLRNNNNAALPAVDSLHPDGYRLVREAGAETGEIRRHRAFYIFDRSVPMGYRRGESLNIEDGILLERIIE